MKKVLLVLSVAALSFVSCSEESVPCNCKVYTWQEEGYNPYIYEPLLDRHFAVLENKCPDYRVSVTVGHGNINSIIDCDWESNETTGGN